MKFRHFALAASALAPGAAPLAAQARTAAPVEGESALAGRATMIALAGLAIIVIGSILIADDEDDPLSV